MNTKKINVITLGCSKNLVDSEKLLKQVEAGGYEIVHNSEGTDAGTVIINTCGFINDAKQESIDTILGYVRARQRGEIRDLFVMGCLAERYMDDLKTEIPEVSRYFGVNNMNDILSELGLARRDDLLGDRTITGPGHYAYLKVSEGCDRTCAFCAIPLIRGKCISRTFEDILAEAETLERKGVKELILVAQDLSWYGLDIYRKQALPELVLQLLKSTNFEWIRLHYLYPANFPAELIPVIRDNPRVCKYIDIPVQHITDTMLGLMKRSHKRQDTELLLNTLRKEIPGAVIRTTLIAGHPGETEAEYGMLRDFVSSFRFDRLGVFACSHEEDTYSFRNYRDEIAEETKQRRVAELMEIQQGISAELNGSYVGKILKVLIDRSDGEYIVGRTEYDSPEVDQEVLIPASSGLTPGLFYDIRITQAEEFDLYGVPA